MNPLEKSRILLNLVSAELKTLQVIIDTLDENQKQCELFKYLLCSYKKPFLEAQKIYEQQSTQFEKLSSNNQQLPLIVQQLWSIRAFFHNTFKNVWHEFSKLAKSNWLNNKVKEAFLEIEIAKLHTKSFTDDDLTDHTIKKELLIFKKLPKRCSNINDTFCENFKNVLNSFQTNTKLQAKLSVYRIVISIVEKKATTIIPLLAQGTPEYISSLIYKTVPWYNKNKEERVEKIKFIISKDTFRECKQMKSPEKDIVNFNDYDLFKVYNAMQYKDKNADEKSIDELSDDDKQLFLEFQELLERHLSANTYENKRTIEYKIIQFLTSMSDELRIKICKLPSPDFLKPLIANSEIFRTLNLYGKESLTECFFLANEIYEFLKLFLNNPDSKGHAHSLTQNLFHIRSQLNAGKLSVKSGYKRIAEVIISYCKKHLFIEPIVWDFMFDLVEIDDALTPIKEILMKHEKVVPTVFSYLDVQSLTQVSLVCKQWKDTADKMKSEIQSSLTP